MAVHTKTIEYAFQSRNTVLASATRYDFGAITLYIPETTSRVFRSVRLQVFCRDTVTTATSLTAGLIGIKLGAVAFDDLAIGAPITNSGESQSFIFERDVTSYFVTNFGAGASQTCQVGVSFTGPTTINIGAKLIITYECEDQQTRVKTVRIPLDSGTGALTATLVEIGTNQIPALSTFLPESSKTIRRVWFELWYNEATLGTTNDSQLGMQVDSETEHLTGAHESGLASSCFGLYFWEQTSATWVASGGGSVHAFKLRSSNITTASTFNHVGIVLCITYEYDHTNSSTILNSLILPMPPLGGAVGNTATDELAAALDFWIEEPATITMVQSGALLAYGQMNAYNPSVAFGAQSERTYTDVSLMYCGGVCLTQRVDSGGAMGSAWTLARGRNRLAYKARNSSGNNGPPTITAALLYLNYTSGKHASGDGVHNKTTIWNVQNSQASRTNTLVAASQWINIPESSRWHNSFAWALASTRGSTGLFVTEISAEGAAGEWEGTVFQGIARGCIVTDTENGTFFTVLPILNCIPGSDGGFDRWVGDPQTLRMDVEGNRRILISEPISSSNPLFIFFTYHCITFTVSGSISDSGGGTVTIRALRDVDGRREELANTSRSGNGAFSMTVYDDTENIYVEAREDATHVGRSERAVAT